jgi:hypothetical protein
MEYDKYVKTKYTTPSGVYYSEWISDGIISTNTIYDDKGNILDCTSVNDTFIVSNDGILKWNKKNERS